MEKGPILKTMDATQNKAGIYSCKSLFTLDTYTHVTTSAKKEAANTMGSILSGALQ